MFEFEVVEFGDGGASDEHIVAATGPIFPGRDDLACSGVDDALGIDSPSTRGPAAQPHSPLRSDPHPGTHPSHSGAATHLSGTSAATYSAPSEPVQHDGSWKPWCSSFLLQLRPDRRDHPLTTFARQCPPIPGVFATGARKLAQHLDFWCFPGLHLF